MERTSPTQYGYITMYKSQRYDVYTEAGSYGAQLIAASYFKVPDKKRHLIAVHLAERPNGEPVIHTPDF